MNKLSIGNGNLVGQVEKLKQLGAKTQKSLPLDLTDRSSEVVSSLSELVKTTQNQQGDQEGSTAPVPEVETGSG
jgi:DNA recombination protein RmuC